MLYKPETYPVESVLRSASIIGAGRGKRARAYADIVTAFDIETSRISVDGEDHAILYVWQWAWENDVIIGRTWDQLTVFIERVNNSLGDAHLAVYIHNAAYEFSFLKGIHRFSADDVFCVDKRRPLKFDWDQIEFRCSFLHSGLSLRAWLNEVKAPHRKLDGKAFDYSKSRYPWTPLTYREIRYCINDVRGIVDAIHIEMQRDGDNLRTIPLTKTGYVRRVIKKALKDNVSYSMMRDMQPSYEVYQALREAFRGGDTHASRFYAGRILDNVHHVDRSSSYPDVMCNLEFPMSEFKRVDNPSMSDVIACMRHHKAVLIRVCMYDVSLTSIWRYGCPYIAYDRCRLVSRDCLLDNGRVLEAGYLEMTLTDVDLRIILRQYNAQIEIMDMWSARYAMLPEPVRREIIDLYHKKTSLKGVTGQELIYNLSKAMINACYGMTAQDPGKPMIQYAAGDERQFVYDTTQHQEELIKAAARKNFLPYQIGVWVTAHARSELHEAIRLLDECPRDADGKPSASFVYCDTDSVFYLGDVDWEKLYNQQRRLRSVKNGAWAEDRKGKPHWMGVMEVEDDCRQFACMGAKKYAILDECGTLHITIAGVAKDVGAVELAHMGGLEKFVDKHNPPLFKAAGGTEIKYNDQVDRVISIAGHTLRLTDNAVIRESTYQMGMTDQYRALLEKIELNIDLIDYMGDLC